MTAAVTTILREQKQGLTNLYNKKPTLLTLELVPLVREQNWFLQKKRLKGLFLLFATPKRPIPTALCRLTPCGAKSAGLVLAREQTLSTIFRAEVSIQIFLRPLPSSMCLTYSCTLPQHPTRCNKTHITTTFSWKCATILQQDWSV